MTAPTRRRPARAMKQAAVGFVARRPAGLGVTVVVATAIVLTALSPVVLMWASSDRAGNPFRGYDWGLLSSVGASYGAASAVLAGLALAAVAASLALQARLVRIAQAQAIRTFQLELFQAAYEHPDLQAGWSTSVDVPYPEWRLRTYTNLVFAYLQMGVDMRFVSDESVKRMLANRFRTEEGRRYWEAARAAWRVDAHGRRQRRFVEMADLAYEEAARTPPLPAPAKPTPGSPPPTKWAPAWVFVPCVLAVAYWLDRRRRSLGQRR